MRSVVRTSRSLAVAPAVVLRGAGQAARIRPWPGQPDVAHLVLLDQGSTPPAALLRAWLHQLDEVGFRTVRTGAIHADQRGPFDALQFDVAQELVLLHLRLPNRRHRERHPLDGRPPTSSRPLEMSRPGALGMRRLVTRGAAAPGPRRARPGELAALAEIDTAAFPTGWALDTVAITDAATATPAHRVAVVLDGGRPAGYAVTGRAGGAAFLQRLAVDPASQGFGMGRRLVEDSVRWARLRRVHTVAVNTQCDNHRALALYESLGFLRRPRGLVVLERELAGPW